MSHQRFAEGNLSTNFIEQEYPDGFSGADLDEAKTKNMLSVGLFIYLKDAERISRITGQMAGRERQLSTRWVVSVDDNSFSVNVRKRPDGYDIQYENYRFGVYSPWSLGSELFQGTVDGKKANVKIENTPSGYILTHSGSRAKVTVRTPRVAELEKYMPKVNITQTSPILAAPISGIIVGVEVKEGDEVKAGQPLMILEAMKMENDIKSPVSGKIVEILVNEGDHVPGEAVLAKIA